MNGSKPSNEGALNVAFFSFLIFFLVQTVFAVIANSQSMLADSEAMLVDIFTYLFNLCAEKIKKLPLRGEEESSNGGSSSSSSSRKSLEYKRELRRQFVELFAPAISISALIAVTITTFINAFRTLLGTGSAAEDEEETVSINIMFAFSAANLLLDLVNVTCFFRANDNSNTEEDEATSPLIQSNNNGNAKATNNYQETLTNNSKKPADEISHSGSSRVNLNMCSAWTVSLARNSPPPNYGLVEYMILTEAKNMQCHAILFFLSKSKYLPTRHGAYPFCWLPCRRV